MKRAIYEARVDRGWRSAHGTVIAASLLLLLVPAGCKSKSKPERGTDESAGKVTDEKVPQSAASASISIPSNQPRALNPLLEVRANRANMLIFEGLVGLNNAEEPVPRLAKSWKLSDDKKVLTFALREGVKWSDGKPFTAKDVQFTFEALRGLSTGKEPTLWAAFMIDVEKVESPDPLTVVVHYKKPYAPALMTWTMGVLPAHVYGGGPLKDSEGNTKPVGTGPYKFNRWDIDKRLVLVANDNWWYGKPKIGRVNLIFGVADQLEALENGELDFVDVPDNARWVTHTQSPKFLEKYEATTVTGSLYRMFAWNTQRAPFKDARVRVALTHALNRQVVVEDLLLGQGQLLSAPMFPNMFGLDRSIAPRRFDLSKAAALLDEAGLPAKADGHRFGFTIFTVTTYRGTLNEEMLAAYRNNLKSIGVDLKVEYLEYETEWKPRVEIKRDFDAVFFGWLPEIPDPDPYNLLHSGQVEVGRQNFAGFKNEEADELLEAARANTNREERRAIYEKLNAVLHRELPYTVAYAPFRHYAWSRRLRGVNPGDIGEFVRFPGLATWWVER